jgi:lysyl-tRNA synthetase
MSENEPQAGGEAAGGEDFLQAQREHRLAKLEALRATGIDPYPVRFDRDTTVADLRSRFEDLARGTTTEDRARIAGRIMLLRRHGGLSFAELRDQEATIQLFVSRDDLGDAEFERFNELDLGDWVGAEGTVMVTRRGELSLRVASFTLLSKALRPLPSKWRGITDPEIRYRQRYLDLMLDEEARRVFRIRFDVIQAIRRYLVERGYHEVETPVLMPEATGAAARPFLTHHNALDIDMYLRIALELPLKRLIVGGLDRVFEISRVFRNEGIDHRHNPEFTLLESYEAFADYHDIMELTEGMVATAAREAIGTTTISVGGREIDLAPPWRRATMAELLREHAGVDMHPSMPVEEARGIARRFGVEPGERWGSGRLMSEVFDAVCEEHLLGPIFVIDHPREVSPLARAHRDDPALVERFEAYVGGRELANAYSELNDPVDQRERFAAQERLQAAGEEEVERIDEDFIRALEYGMPPTGGLGVGIDRLVTLLAGVESIRDVILFPTMRPEQGSPPASRAEDALPTARELAEPPTVAGEDAQAPRVAPVTALPQPGVVHTLSLLTLAGGLITMITPLPGVHRLTGSPFLATSPRAAVHVLTVLAGLGLVLTARPLWRRKHRAWQAAVALFVAATALHLVKGPSLVAAAICAAMVVALVAERGLFMARGDPRSPVAALGFLVVWLGAVLVYGTAALLVDRDDIRPDITVAGVLKTVFGGLVGLDGPYTYERPLFDRYYSASLVALGVMGLVIFAVLLFRPLAEPAGAAEDDREHARRLVRAWGSDTLAYFSLRDDKTHFFSSDGRAMVSYAYHGGYALASGDPVGAPESIPLVLDEFLLYCRERAWHVAFLAVQEREAERYRARGLHSIYLGDEAIVRCDRFALGGRRMKKAREAVRRVARRHTFELIRATDASPELIAELNAISMAWRGKAPERGFTMALGTDVMGREPDFLLAVARDEDRRPAAFLRLVPVYGSDPGYSLDLMRRLPGAQNGITEFLICRTALTLGARGFRRLSMNFATWGRLFHADVHLSPVQRCSRALVSLLNPYFQIRSLYEFSQRFDPEWLSRAIVVEDPAAAPRVGLMFATVEGFVQRPSLRRLVPRTRRGADAPPDAPGSAVPA